MLRRFLHSRIVWVIFALQMALGLYELIDVIDALQHGREFWAFFFMTIVNFPVSMPVLLLAETLRPYLNDEIGMGLTCVLLVVFGTVWWSMLIHGVVCVVKTTSFFIKKRMGKNKNHL